MFLYAAIESDGQLQATTSGSVTSVHNGISYVGSRILVDTGAVAGSDTFHNGLRFNTSGELRVVNANGANQSQGFEVDSNGRLAVNTGTVGAGTYNNGVLMDANGRAYMDIS